MRKIKVTTTTERHSIIAKNCITTTKTTLINMRSQK